MYYLVWSRSWAYYVLYVLFIVFVLYGIMYFLTLGPMSEQNKQRDGTAHNTTARTARTEAKTLLPRYL